MAKVKVHELAKAVNKQSKDLIAFLNDKGIEVKAAQSVVDDGGVALVYKEFGGGAATKELADTVNEKAAPAKKSPAKEKLTEPVNETPASENLPVAENPPNPEKAPVAKKTPTTELPPTVAAAPTTAENPAAEREKTPSSANPRSERPSASEAPRKKKRIIINLNPENSGRGSQRGGFSPGGAGRSSGPRPGGPRPNISSGKKDTPHKIIRPLTAPSIMESSQPEKKVAPPPKRRPPAIEKEAAALSPDIVKEEGPVAPVTPDTVDVKEQQPVEDSAKVARAPAKPPKAEGSAPARPPAARTGERVRPPRSEGQRRSDSPGGTPRSAAPGQRGGPRAASPNYSSDQRSSQGGGRPGQAGRQAPDRRSGPGRPGPGRPGMRPGMGRPGGRGGEGNRHQDSVRKANAERDRRGKKEFRFVDEDALANTRQRRVGAFQRPVRPVGKPVEEQIKVITLPESLTIKELAEKMKMPPSVIVKKLFLQGQVATVNTEVTYEEAENIAIEFDIICEKEVIVDIIEELLKEEEENPEEMRKRPPIICVMGHVDHGKTSLLDTIRKTSVTDKESGGITQHIGAYTVEIHGQSITFLDTPGHEAFTAMRMRGATATDIAILVIAADDGVMPQTKEAISHAKAAGIEIIVAINKIDKPGANMDRVKQEMTEHELIPTDWGGQTEFVPVSAKTGEGIESLLETIVLTSDIMELKANPLRQARGLVIEAELDKGRGPVATVLVQKGCLNVGDFISAGACYGKVRAMIDDKGHRVKEALPSMPVEILGLSDVPSAGEIFIAHESDKTAKTYADTYRAQHKVRMLDDIKAKMSLDDLFTKIQAGNLKELNIIVKADVQGSVEALRQSLLKLSNEEVVVKCIHGGVGAINESDVSLASTSSAIIIGFNVRPDVTAKASAEREGVDIRLYKVIYQAIEDIEAAMKGMLDPIFEEKVLGHAEIRQIFRASALGNISGSYVLDGVMQRNCLVRISRDGEQIYEGELASLKRFKDDVREVRAGYECGLVFDGFDQVQELDMVEAYTMVEVPRS